ncbi:hypothetical protein CEXT_44701 [Caerostris extrusa]|uniref:Uncharacterized protein n=1 Tax=Caerostris extrusa TaxID=172846 RepID=A0AAV4TTX2_CAEEX|nr:hypothetical protein CEXT_44701 [Caerostris extrusa]
MSKPSKRNIGSSVVECSPATRATRFRFPADDRFLPFFQPADRTIFSAQRNFHAAMHFSVENPRDGALVDRVVECSPATRASP